MLTPTEKSLLDISNQFGLVTQSNCNFTMGLAESLEQIDKPIEEMTVRELSDHIKQYDARYQKSNQDNLS